MRSCAQLGNQTTGLIGVITRLFITTAKRRELNFFYSSTTPVKIVITYIILIASYNRQCT